MAFAPLLQFYQVHEFAGSVVGQPEKNIFQGLKPANMLLGLCTG
jgi:hypothetical protein